MVAMEVRSDTCPSASVTMARPRSRTPGKFSKGSAPRITRWLERFHNDCSRDFQVAQSAGSKRLQFYLNCFNRSKINDRCQILVVGRLFSCFGRQRPFRSPLPRAVCTIVRSHGVMGILRDAFKNHGGKRVRKRCGARMESLQKKSGLLNFHAVQNHS